MKTRSDVSSHYEEEREAMSENRRDHQQGFALILAILALMLLTFLGLTLATTTSTELRIATNYRWNTQALYNAEAGIEAGKRILQGLNWDSALPRARTTTWTPPATLPFTATLPANPPGGLSTSPRNYEMGDCDTLGNGVGYGVVLFDGTYTFDGITVVPSFASAPALNGAFTLWVRRPVVPAGGGNYVDDPAPNTMILTAEGIAPYAGGLAGALARNNQARRIVEVSVRRQDQPAPCDQRGGQLGGGPENNNVFGGICNPLDTANALGNITFAPGGKSRITP
jgi:hypothetical protein